MSKDRRFSGTQITVMVVTACVAVVGAPVGVLAATGSLVNITDPVTASHKARVDSTGALKVAGAVSGTVTTRPAAPASPFSRMWEFTGLDPQAFAVPAGKNFAITSITLANDGNSVTNTDVTLDPEQSANCATYDAGTILRWVTRLAAPGNDSRETTFPTPIVIPKASTERCILVYAPPSDNATWVTMTGYFY